MSDRPVPGPRSESMSTPSLLLLAVLAFVVELALFGGVGAIAYRSVDGGATAWLAAVGATVAVVVLWGLFVAPKARFRLGAAARVAVTALLCLATAYGLVTVGLPVWGWFVGIAGLAVVAAQLVLPTHGDRPASTDRRPTRA